MLGGFEHLASRVDHVGLHLGLADRIALGSEEGEHHGTADENGVCDVHEVVDDAYLVRDLGTTQNGDEGPLGILEHRGERLDLLGEEQAAYGRDELGHAADGCVGAMRRAEGVVNVDVA